MNYNNYYFAALTLILMFTIITVFFSKKYNILKLEFNNINFNTIKKLGSKNNIINILNSIILIILIKFIITHDIHLLFTTFLLSILKYIDYMNYDTMGYEYLRKFGNNIINLSSSNTNIPSDNIGKGKGKSYEIETNKTHNINNTSKIETANKGKNKLSEVSILAKDLATTDIPDHISEHLKDSSKRKIELAKLINNNYDSFKDKYYNICSSKIRKDIINMENGISKRAKDIIPFDQRYTEDDSSITRKEFISYIKEQELAKVFERTEKLKIMNVIYEEAKIKYEGNRMSLKLLDRSYEIYSGELIRAKQTEHIVYERDNKYRLNYFDFIAKKK
jgi:hypothetical protein